MTIKKIGPNNLPALKRHFENELKTNQKKLKTVDKRRAEIVQTIETMKDGIEWCQNVYKASTSK